MRVVATTCSNTEIVCALGCADRLVGVDQHSDYPEEVVRALQKLTGGPTVEVIARPTDAVTGAFSYALPASAPQRGGYVVAPALPAFTADSGVAGKYTLEALVPGKPAQTADIDLSGADVTTLFTVAP